MIECRPGLKWDNDTGTLFRWSTTAKVWIRVTLDHPYGKLSESEGNAIRTLVYNLGCEHYLTQLPEHIIQELIDLLNAKVREPTKEELIEIFPFMKEHIE